MKKVYLDTNVIMDIVLNRFDRPRMIDMVNSDYIFVISDFIIKELEYNKQSVYLFFNTLKSVNKLIVHIVCKEDRIIAKKFLRWTHFNDAIHASVCFNLKIPIVTRNIKDFENLPIEIIHSNKL